MHIFLAADQSPCLCSKRGGGGDAGAAEHQLGLTDKEGVGCWAPTLAADKAAITAIVVAIQGRSAVAMDPSRLA